MIKYFTIYGERCSGTNFLLHAIKDNFNLEFSNNYSWKHFFGHYNFEKNDIEDETLFIGIIRNPIEWIDSFYKKMHHIPSENKINIFTFLFNEFHSVYENSNKEIMEDRHILTKERYKNIFELRKVKNNYLTKTMPNSVKNYILIRYEDLRDNYEAVLNFIKQKFNLIQKNNIYKKIFSYKGNNELLYIKKKIILKKRIIKLILHNLDTEQENGIGYK